MIDVAILAFATFFATIGPPDVAVVFAALTAKNTSAERRHLAVKATLVGSTILLFFAFLGKPLLDHLGISLAAMRTAGGIFLFLIHGPGVCQKFRGNLHNGRGEGGGSRQG